MTRPGRAESVCDSGRGSRPWEGTGDPPHSTLAAGAEGLSLSPTPGTASPHRRGSGPALSSAARTPERAGGWRRRGLACGRGAAPGGWPVGAGPRKDPLLTPQARVGPQVPATPERGPELLGAAAT